jgi:hypothetical protein
MDDEILSRLPALVGVVHTCVDEGVLDPAAVDRRSRLVRMLLDDREQVREQPSLGRGQLGAVDLRVRLGMLQAIDRRAGAREQRRTRFIPRAGAGSVLLAAPRQPPGR